MIGDFVVIDTEKSKKSRVGIQEHGDERKNEEEGHLGDAEKLLV